jgi:hypothetical protein
MPDLWKLQEAIAALLDDDDEFNKLVKRTGLLPSSIFHITATPKEKVEKTYERLRKLGNARWFLTWVLIHAADDAELRLTITDAFPNTLSRLPLAEEDVSSASNFLLAVLNIPITEELRYKLRPKQRSISNITQSIITLFAYKCLQEYLFTLLFSLNVNDALLSNPAHDVAPDLPGLADLIDEIVTEAPTTVQMVGPATAAENKWIDELQPYSASLRAAQDKPEAAMTIIDAIQRLVRDNLTRLTDTIFAAVKELSFDALTHELPPNVQTRSKFTDFVQAVYDVKATVLARALKTKMWQDAENRMSLISNYFEAPEKSTNMAKEWFALRDQVDWLAGLEHDERWATEAKQLAIEIDDEIAKEAVLDDEARMHFETYRSWIRGPFKKVDETLKVDCGALCKIDDPLKKILADLSR